jgi:hypothetical protein
MGVLRLARHFKIEKDMILNERRMKGKVNGKELN